MTGHQQRHHLLQEGLRRLVEGEECITLHIVEVTLLRVRELRGCRGEVGVASRQSNSCNQDSTGSPGAYLCELQEPDRAWKCVGVRV